ncbi:MAG: hypothetical protein N2422_10500 [Rhodobacteraceae bacterium]|nr:hypothetical protein [Paracoccaceae bacterium]
MTGRAAFVTGHAAALALLAAALAAAAAGPAAAEDFGFAVDLRFDRVTIGTLVEREEGIVVSAVFYGEANEAGQDQADEMGTIWLGNAEFTLAPDDQTVIIPGNIDRAALKWVEGGVVRANVNVYSARFSDEANILDCGIFDDDVRVAQAATPQIECTLLGN